MVAMIKATDNSYVTRNLMGDCTAYVEFFTSLPITFKIGDRCNINSRYYFIKDQVVPERDKNRLRYQLTLYGTMYELEKKIMFVQDSTGVGEVHTTSWDCTPAQFLALLCNNMAELQPAALWHAGDAKEIAARTVSISANNCLEALQEAARVFECDYNVDEYKVSLISATSPAEPLELEEGYGKGIREIKANKSNDSAIVTRLYPYGGSTNTDDGLPITIDPVDADDPDCLVEGIKVFEDIYPRVIGEVIDQEIGGDYALIHVSNIDFYIESYRINGLEARIKFLTGQLAGLEFKFHHVISNVILLYYQTYGGVQVPGATGYNAQEGDEFEIINISMPETYIEDAQDRLMEAALEYLAEHKTQKMKLNVKLDEFYLTSNAIQLELQNYIKVKSSIVPWLSAGVAVQVIGFKQMINFPYRYDSLVLGDVSIPQGLQQIVKIVEKQTILKTTVVGSQPYRHPQIIPSTTWTCVHNMDKWPSVTVSDVDGRFIQPDEIQHLNKNVVIITFPAAIAGYADFN